MKELTKGLILSAGFGTRFLPASKTIPKEMFPIIDKPALEFTLEEFAHSGIREILIVSSRRKKAMEDFIDREIELENLSSSSSKPIESIVQKEKLSVYFIRQTHMGGTGDAVLLAKSFFGNSPFILAYPDDIIFSEKPLALQMIEMYQKHGNSVLALENGVGSNLSQYGIIQVRHSKTETPLQNKEIPIAGIVEKPKPGTEPSSYISIGRYLLTSEIFSLLTEEFNQHETIHPGKEFYLTSALNRLAQENRLMGLEFEGKRMDVGTPLGYLKTFHEYALRRSDLAGEYLDFLKNHQATQKAKDEKSP